MGILLRFASPIALFCCVVLVLSAGGGGAGGAEVLVNGGFEGGVDPWQVTNGDLDGVAAPVHGGTGAARLIGDGTQVQHEVFQWVEVNPGAPYELTAWVLHNDPNVSSVFLRVVWGDENLGQVSTADSLAPVTFASPAYQPLTTGVVVAPLAARYARIGIRVVPGAGPAFDFTIFIDDVSLVGPDPTDTPLPTTAPSPTATPAPTPSASATPTTPAGTPAPSRTPTSTPRRSPTPVPEDSVFGSLTNGGFETLRGDGTPFAWRKFGGEMRVTNDVRFEGSYALRLSSTTTSTKWAYQNVAIQGGAYYEASVMALLSDDNVDEAFLRVSWYDTDDASGESIDSVDSLMRLSDASDAFRHITTGPVQAPPEARTARVRLMYRPKSSAPAEVFFDSVSFDSVARPTATATPFPSKQPTITPTAIATEAPTATAVPSVSPTLTPAATPNEPDVFPALVNGSFEDVREDGTPYGWRKFGGEFAATGLVAAQGELSVEVLSNTDSTKWIWQVVSVSGGTYYEAAGLVQAYDPGIEAAFLRISWYASEDGSGDALDSSDSLPATGQSPDFVPLATGAVRAPTGAHTARIKAMLRPAGEGPARVYFDAISFQQVPAPTSTPEPARPSVAPPASTSTPLSPAPEATTFSSLANGDFEQLRPDGSPYGWRNIGGTMTAGPPASSGSYALVLASATDSMKWAYQTVSIGPGRYYSASVDVIPISGQARAFIRVSWYHSPDGSGEAVDQVDSSGSLFGRGFLRVTTGPILAPPGVNSAKVRLVLRPTSDAPASVAFDQATFGQATLSGGEPFIAGEDQIAEPASQQPQPRVLGAATSPVPPVNVDPDGEDEPAQAEQDQTGGSSYDWIIALAVGIPIGGLLTAGAITLRNRRQP